MGLYTMRQQKIIKSTAKTKPTIINNKQLAAAEKASQGSDKPVRTVYYVEVSQLTASQIDILMTEVGKHASTLKGGAHYIIPVRNGKIRTDIHFEAEFLQTVNKLCEVKDGQIIMRGGAQDVIILREQV